MRGTNASTARMRGTNASTARMRGTNTSTARRCVLGVWGYSRWEDEMVEQWEQATGMLLLYAATETVEHMSYAMSGTDIGYAATAMLLPGVRPERATRESIERFVKKQRAEEEEEEKMKKKK
eukprot:3746939-Rhodomonas_salina.1